jgi:hypothetical protein
VPNRVIVCYRDVNLDPITDLTLKTINWRDPVLNRPEQVLMGIQYNDNSSPPKNGQRFFPSYVVTTPQSLKNTFAQFPSPTSPFQHEALIQ